MYNILICDDEQDIVNALKIYLSGGDYCLFEASNGREALEVVEKNDIHLILMDIMMPQLDGIAATAKLEARQLWSATAMCLVLLPVAMVVAGLWMGIAGLITGVQWALDVDGSVWLGIGRWLVVGAGLAGAGYGLFASVRWVAGLAETWKGRGMPKWPCWRKR